MFVNLFQSTRILFNAKNIDFIKRLSYQNLKQICKNHNVKSNSKKADLVDLVYMINNNIQIPNAHIIKNHKNSQYKKKHIPKILKRLVWNKYIGEEKGISPCLCCKSTIISQMNFVCGHVISEKHGGTTSIENLRPICSLCNNSMGITNMEEFIKKYNL